MYLNTAYLTSQLKRNQQAQTGKYLKTECKEAVYNAGRNNKKDGGKKMYK